MTRSPYLRGISPLAPKLLKAIEGLKDPPLELRKPLRDAIRHRKAALMKARLEYVAKGNTVEVEEPYRGGA